MLRSKIFLITKRSFATSQHLTIGSIFSQTCQKNSSALSLISSHQRIRLDYGRLSSVCTAFASALLKLKYKRGDRIALALKNDAENLVTQLSCSMIGVSVVTAKDNDQLKQLSAELSCKGLIIDASNGVKHESDALVKDPLHPTIFTGHCGGINQSHLSFDELVKSPIISIPSDIPAEIPVAFYGTSSKSVNHLDLIKSAHAILMELRLGTWDRVCLPVTLNHTFGFGSGALAALVSGSTLVLPGSGKDPNTTVRALDEEGCTVFLTDTHDLAKLRQLQLSGRTLIPWWASAGGSEGALRAGLVKVGSGDVLGMAPLDAWCGVPLTSIGNPPGLPNRPSNSH